MIAHVFIVWPLKFIYLIAQHICYTKISGRIFLCSLGACYCTSGGMFWEQTLHTVTRLLPELVYQLHTQNLHKVIVCAGNPLTIYRSLSGPSVPKPKKSLSGPEARGAPESLEKVSKKSLRDLFKTFPDSRDFQNFPDSRGSRGRSPQKTFFRLFGVSGPEVPRDFFRWSAGSQCFRVIYLAMSAPLALCKLSIFSLKAMHLTAERTQEKRSKMPSSEYLCEKPRSFWRWESEYFRLRRSSIAFLVPESLGWTPMSCDNSLLKGVLRLETPSRKGSQNLDA